MATYRLFETRTTDNVGAVSDGVAISGAGNTYSNKMSVEPLGLVGFTLAWTGTLAGTFTLWYSDKDNPSLANDDDWVQDTSWAPTNPAGSAGKTKYVISGIMARWVRVKFAYTSGSGTLTGYESD